MGRVSSGAKRLGSKAARATGKAVVGGIRGAVTSYLAGGSAAGGALTGAAGSGTIGAVIQTAQAARAGAELGPTALQQEIASVLFGFSPTQARIEAIGRPITYDDHGEVTDERNGVWHSVQVQLIGSEKTDDDAAILRRAAEILNASVRRHPGGWFEFSTLTGAERIDAVVRDATDDAVRSIRHLSDTIDHASAGHLPVSAAEALDLPTLAAKVEKHFPGTHIWGFIPTKDGGFNMELASAPAPDFFNADVLTLYPKAKPEFIDAWAQDREPRQRLIHFDGTRNQALIATLDPFTAALRDRTAELLKCRPWDVQLTIRTAINEDGSGRVDAVEYTRLPNANADGEKRIGLLIALRDLVPGSTEHWAVEEDPLTGRATISHRSDGLQGTVAYDWSIAPTIKTIPFGVTELGDPLSLGLLESNLLLGGIPGSGKSGGATALLAGISRLENVALIGLDPKRVELSPWKDRFSIIAKKDDHASFVLASVEAEMERRYEWLDSEGLKKFTPEMFTAERPLLVVFIDELADLVSVGVTKEEKDAEQFRSTRVRRLIAKGRASGVVVVTATQKPQSDVIPTSLRDLIQQRVGFATTNAAMTETILGAGMAQNGGLSHNIAASDKGVCFVVNEESRTPVRARAAWIPDEDVAGIAAQTAHLRIPLGWLPTEADTAEAAKKLSKDVSWSDLLPEPTRYAPEPVVLKPGERVTLPAPDESVFATWENRFVTRDLAATTTPDLDALAAPAPETSLDPTDLFNERKDT